MTANKEVPPVDDLAPWQREVLEAVQRADRIALNAPHQQGAVRGMTDDASQCLKDPLNQAPECIETEWRSGVGGAQCDYCGRTTIVRPADTDMLDVPITWMCRPCAVGDPA